MDTKAWAKKATHLDPPYPYLNYVLILAKKIGVPINKSHPVVKAKWTIRFPSTFHSAVAKCIIAQKIVGARE